MILYLCKYNLSRRKITLKIQRSIAILPKKSYYLSVQSLRLLRILQDCFTRNAKAILMSHFTREHVRKCSFDVKTAHHFLDFSLLVGDSLKFETGAGLDRFQSIILRGAKQSFNFLDSALLRQFGT